MKRVFLILFTSLICLCVGVTVVYYNTASLGYDNAVVLSVNDDVVTIIGFNINYKETEKKLYRKLKPVTDSFITI